MIIRKIYITVLFALLPASIIFSQAPFSRGVNLTNWFQTSGARAIQFTKFTEQDIKNIKSLGCDVIRLPINLHTMTKGSPAYTVDPLLFNFLDSVVTWCEKQNIYLILDNHSFDPSGSTTSGIEDILTKIWVQVAEHFKSGSEYILYEILNEPNGISTSSWGAIQGRVITAIRLHDIRHTIVVGGSGFNTYTELKNLPVYTDTKLLYTFHFYDPFVFTHQGATWVTPSMAPLTGVPYPYNSSAMPACPASLKGSWIESGLNSYSSQGNAAYIRQLIDNAVNFRDSRHVNIFCGEFGVYIQNSQNTDRCTWYSAVRNYLNEKNIPWTIWDYKGGFGIFTKGSPSVFEHDVNTRMIDSLGLTIPAQTPYVMKADSTGFMIYSDYIFAGIEDESTSSGSIDYYAEAMPSNGKYCISWNGFAPYNKIGFDFVPDKDLSRLVSGNYAIDFMVRGDSPGIKFDIRFIDTKTAVAGDHPWRMRSVIDATDALWDRKWHHVRIPLSLFTEHGSWDVDTWYSPQGKFDWTKIDNFEISTEYSEIIGHQVWFDNICISDLDTAVVRVTGPLGIEKLHSYGSIKISATPNPVVDHTMISFTIETEHKVKAEIFTLSGSLVRNLCEESFSPGKNNVEWDCRAENGTMVLPGMYLCRLQVAGLSGITRIMVTR